jgi:hypothetical protein
MYRLSHRGWLFNLFSQSKLSHIFKSVVFGKDGKGISFKNRLKGHTNPGKKNWLSLITWIGIVTSPTYSVAIDT